MDDFLVLFVGKWEKRKNLKILLRCFYESLGLFADTSLVVLTSSYHSSEDFEKEIHSFLLSEKRDWLSSSGRNRIKV